MKARLRGFVATACLALVCAGASAAQPAGAEGRVIVKYRGAVAASAKPSRQAAPAALSTRLEALGKRRGLPLRAQRGLSESMQVVTAAGLTSADLARRLSADADVEFSVPDRRMKRAAVAPNDALFESGGTEGPAAGQWYLKSPADPIRSSIDAVSAWDLTTGSADVVVAVLDTGVRYDHPDLLAASAGGKLLPGYDFVRASIANDGDDRDDDASDPGDWVTQADIDAGTVAATECEVDASSWHGTQVTGLIAALTNNGAGMAGTSWGARVLPLRVLGKCGGFQSEIIAAMRWAVGLPVPNAPLNPTPARVLNLSLGGPGACDAAYQGAIDEVAAAGAVIVSSAGNSAGHDVGSPANCRGVIGVGGLRHTGTKVGFSDLGPGVALSAPAGNCVNVVGPCVYPILTTTDTGLQGPVGPSYTDGRNLSVGTSFSAPLVSGVAALMLSVQPALSAAQVADLLQGGARPFPPLGAASDVPACTAPQFDASGAPVDQYECTCTTATCGAGMLDAYTAVRSASAGVIGKIVSGTPSPVAAQPIELQSEVSPLVAGASASSVSWSLVDGGGIVTGFTGSTNGVTASVMPSAAGTFTVALTVIDSNAKSSTTSKRFDVAAAPVVAQAAEPAAPDSGGGAIGIGYLAALLVAVLAAWRVRRNPRAP